MDQSIFDKLGITTPKMSREEWNYQKITKKFDKVKSLKSKLNSLRSRASKASREKKAISTAEPQILAEQKYLAIQDLILEVKLAITQNIQQLYDDLPEEYSEIQSEIKKLHDHFEQEKLDLDKDEIQFYGIRKIFQQLKKGDDSAWVEVAKRDLQNSKQALIDEFGLGDEITIDIGLQTLKSKKRRLKEIEHEIVLLNKAIENCKIEDYPSIEIDPSADRNALIHMKAEEEAERELLRFEIANDLSRLCNKIQYEIEVHQTYIEELKMGSKSLHPDDIAEEIEEVESTISCKKQKLFKLHQELQALPRSSKEAIAGMARLKYSEEFRKAQSGMSFQDRIKGLLSANLDDRDEASRIHTFDRLPVDYKWEKTDWGKCLFDSSRGLLSSSFGQEMASLKGKRRDIREKIAVLRERKRQISSNLGNNRHIDSGAVASDRKGEHVTAGIFVQEWEQQILELDRAIFAAKEAEHSLQIEIRGKFLDQIIVETNKRTAQIKTLKNNLNGKHGIKAEIKTLTKKIHDTETRIISIEVDGHVDCLERERKKLAYQKKELALQQIKRKKTLRKIEQLENEVESLLNGYEKQRGKYMRLRKPKTSLVDEIKNYFNSFNPLNLISEEWQYIPIGEFDTRMEFARFGYTIEDGLSAFFAKEDGQSLAKKVESSITEFISFAENYPEIAEAMFVDFSLAIRTFNDEGLLYTLHNGIRERARYWALMGEAGRDIRPRPKMTEETFQKVKKWKALADYASNLPEGVAFAKSLKTAWDGYTRGGIVNAAVHGLIELIKANGQIKAERKFIMSIKRRNLAAMTGLFGCLTGQEVQDILAEQRNLALLSLVGNARLTLFRTGEVVASIKRLTYEQIDAVKYANWPERIVRIGAILVAPPAIISAGIAVSIIVLEFEGLILAGTVAIAAAVASVALPVLLMSFASKLQAFQNTMEIVKRIHAKDHIAQHNKGEYKDKIRKEAQEMMEKMEEKGFIVPHIPEDMYLEVHKKLEIRLLSKMRDYLNEKEKNFLRLLRQIGHEPSVREVAQIFRELARPDIIKSEIEAIVDSVKFTDQHDKPSRHDRNTIRDLYTSLVSQELKRRCLGQHLHEAMENEMINMILSRKSIKEFESEAAVRITRKKEELQRKVDEKLASSKVSVNEEEVYKSFGWRKGRVTLEEIND